MHFKILEIIFLKEKSGKIFLKPDRSRNRILKPDIRPEQYSVGHPVGSYYVQPFILDNVLIINFLET